MRAKTLVAEQWPVTQVRPAKGSGNDASGWGTTGVGTTPPPAPLSPEQRAPPSRRSVSLPGVSLPPQQQQQQQVQAMVTAAAPMRLSSPGDATGSAVRLPSLGGGVDTAAPAFTSAAPQAAISQALLSRASASAATTANNDGASTADGVRGLRRLPANWPAGQLDAQRELSRSRSRHASRCTACAMTALRESIFSNGDTEEATAVLLSHRLTHTHTHSALGSRSSRRPPGLHTPVDGASAFPPPPPPPLPPHDHGHDHHHHHHHHAAGALPATASTALPSPSPADGYALLLARIEKLERKVLTQEVREGGAALCLPLPCAATLPISPHTDQSVPKWRRAVRPTGCCGWQEHLARSGGRVCGMYVCNAWAAWRPPAGREA